MGALLSLISNRVHMHCSKHFWVEYLDRLLHLVSAISAASLRLSACISDIAGVWCNIPFISAEAILHMHKTCCCAMLLHYFEIGTKSKQARDNIEG